jgi:hypothetical protein
MRLQTGCPATHYGWVLHEEFAYNSGVHFYLNVSQLLVVVISSAESIAIFLLRYFIA